MLLRGFNDGLDDARELVKYASDVHAKVNLIEYNPTGDGEFGRTDAKDAEAFQRFLEEKGVTARIRRSRGRDIDAACGQLGQQEQGPSLKAERSTLKWTC